MLGLGEKRKEEKGEENSRFVDFLEICVWISSRGDTYETQVTRINIQRLFGSSASLIQLSTHSLLMIMPPRKATTGHPTRRNIEEQGVPNTPEMQPQ
uniref:Uncharacterized protein n=1 Tax=Solanum tuberosum TaxID=4113 RepID=M1DQN6_SOLTU